MIGDSLRNQGDGESVLERLAAEAAGSLRPGGGESAGTGRAIRGEHSVGLEDFCAAAAHGADRADRAAAWAARSKVTGAVGEQLRSWIGEQSDWTLQELQLRLWKMRRVSLSIGRLWGALRELRLPLKTSRSTPRSKTRRKTGSGARRGRSRANGLIPGSGYLWMRAV